ncbi:MULTISPECIES: hypothetical protein [Mycobacteroides]|uniref:hypothetical protein n=1 Tax=Mycobacteroides TaxID=670516 RepID=UPI0007150183|nr:MULTISPECIES: hypothetical protein [Mycobacteroides]KRQ20559.1 hypothetical protein AOT91_26895 [Mycobacteroides sp. H092]KRQ26143.1 hypothetical protein AOT87_08665 [Mycobacteroides sp. H003]KRQ35278.1 hypothetical protein AOT92_24285 [Mycobacteroides sp. H101]KRQ53485.1 hypothetical protein AOT88_00765 [Mycobacteroides sp. H063]KRQ59094.1 hypothetical protein AOT90_24070 [Mycobacteroides sp. H079]
MAYVSRPPSGFFGGYDVGYYTPDGNWQSHTAGLSQSAADELVNTLNGGNVASSRIEAERREEAERQRRRDEANERRIQEKAALKLERERRSAAEQEAANLAKRERMNAETAVTNERQRAEWEQAQERDRAAWIAARDAERDKWLATQAEDRRRAEAEVAEQLRRFPPKQTVTIGGLDGWHGNIAYRLRTGEVVTVPVTDII